MACLIGLYLKMCFSILIHQGIDAKTPDVIKIQIQQDNFSSPHGISESGTPFISVRLSKRITRVKKIITEMVILTLIFIFSI